MDEEQNLAGGTAREGQPSTPSAVTPELAESLPYAELKARMRAEARDYVEPATAETTAPDEGGEETTNEAVTSEAEGAVRDPQTGRFTNAETTPQADTATERGTEPQRGFKRPETLDEAIRVLDSLRGNLNTAVTERSSVQRRVQELEAETTRLRQEAENARIQSQHARFEELVSRLPAEQQGLARAEYVSRLQQQAMGDYVREVQQREQTLQQREFVAAKAEVPALYEDIAKFVADQHGVPADELVALVKSPHVKALIDSAGTPEAIQQASIAFGQLLDYEGTKLAGRLAAEKAQRREAKAQTAVRDMPSGVTAGGAQEDVVTKINAMSSAEFAEYKKRLLRAAAR